jgi:regulator of nucleoside diphosphate kinase
MKSPSVYFTEADAASLRRFIASRLVYRNAEIPALKRLSEEVERASVDSTGDIPEEVVRIGSPVTVEFTDFGESMTCTLVYPDEADLDTGRVSILAPMGIALLGCRAGDEIEWPAAAGTLRARILKTPPRH